MTLNGPLDEHETETPVWMRHRKCRDTDPAFFYPNGGNGRVQEAKRFCNGGPSQVPCPVRDECLDHALTYGEKFGVWGGTSERDRRKLKKTWPLRETA